MYKINKYSPFNKVDITKIFILDSYTKNKYGYNLTLKNVFNNNYYFKYSNNQIKEFINNNNGENVIFYIKNIYEYMNKECYNFNILVYDSNNKDDIISLMKKDKEEKKLIWCAKLDNINSIYSYNIGDFDSKFISSKKGGHSHEYTLYKCLTCNKSANTLDDKEECHLCRNWHGCHNRCTYNFSYCNDCQLRSR